MTENALKTENPPLGRVGLNRLFAVDSPVESGAEFSDCRTYRYALWRKWDWQGFANQVMFIGLNPSTADETEDDPTIRRCIRFAKDRGFGGLMMMNATNAVQVRNLGDVRWLSVEDGSQGKGTGRHIAAFILYP